MKNHRTAPSAKLFIVILVGAIYPLMNGVVGFQTICDVDSTALTCGDDDNVDEPILAEEIQARVSSEGKFNPEDYWSRLFCSKNPHEESHSECNRLPLRHCRRQLRRYSPRRTFLPILCPAPQCCLVPKEKTRNRPGPPRHSHYRKINHRPS